MSYEIVTANTNYPLSLTEVKEHLKTDALDTSEDATLTIYLAAATAEAQLYCRRFFMKQTLNVFFDDWCNHLSLTCYSPVITVVSVKYIDTDGVTQTLATTEYEVDNKSLTPKVIITGSTPSIHPDKPNAIIIQVMVGYSNSDVLTDQQTAVPFMIKAAILLQVGRYYSTRDNTSIKTVGMVRASELLLTPHITSL